MKKILCIHTGKSYFPEIEAYKAYFNIYKNFKFIDCVKDLNNSYNIDDYDILWYMMGTDFNKHNKIKIHDYASLSTGNFTYIKNKIKTIFNEKPHMRLFLNNVIKDTLKFNDNAPFKIRDMGVDKKFFECRTKEKLYDFLYIGSITKERKIPQLLEIFKNKIKNKKILVIGSVPDSINRLYCNVDNIIFAGKIDYLDVPGLASKCEYAINMIPNIYPFNVQTSTKLLEYCALGLKIITTNYNWIHSFTKEYSANFYIIDENLEKMNFEEIENFNYVTPDIKKLEWISLLNKINLNDCIKKL